MWDTVVIPRGSVSSKAFLMNNAEELLDESRMLTPGRTQNFQCRTSFGSSGRDHTEARMYPSSPRILAPTSPAHLTMTQKASHKSRRFEPTRPSPNGNPASPLNQFNIGPQVQDGNRWRQHSPVSRRIALDSWQGDMTTGYAPLQVVRGKSPSRRGEVSSPFLQHSVAPVNRASERFSSWKPSQEIPKGTVKGRMTALFGRTATSSDGVSRAIPKQTRQTMLESTDDDPWVTPPKSTANVSVGDWGQAVQAKSDDSEEWDNPNTDWLQPNRTLDAAVVTNEVFESRSGTESREDVIKTAARKKELFDAFGQPLRDASDRDMEMVLAAKRKSQLSSQLHELSGRDRQGFSTAFSDDDFEKQAFPDNDAFGSSFADLYEPNKILNPELPIPSNDCTDAFLNGGFEDTFYDAEPTFYDSPKEVQTCHNVEQETAPSTQVEELAPKRERKSIFNIFGGSRKDKGAKKSKSKFSFGSSSISKRTPISSGNDHRSSTPTKQMADCKADDMQQKQRIAHQDYVTNSPNNIEASHQIKFTTENRNISTQQRTESLNAAPKHEAALRPFCVEDNQRVEMGAKSPEDADALSHHQTLQGDQLEGIHDGSSKHKKALHTGRELELVTSSSEVQTRVETLADEDHSNVKVILQPDSEVEAARINTCESANPELSRLATDCSEDSDSVGSRGLLNNVKTHPHSRIVRSGADRKKKTEKLRKYGEVNSRLREPLHQESGSSKLDLSHSRTLKNSRYTKEVHDKGVQFEAKPTNGSRHARIKCNIAVSKVAKRLELEDGLSTNQKRSKARNYARQRAGFMIDNFIHSNSSESAESVTLASAGSDIRVLRSILRRPRQTPVSEISAQSIGEFPTFEEETLDPMQQAGLKMLSATIIPMQAQVRRFLAMRRALTRMWALIVIQAHTRRWIAEKRLKNTLQSAVTIQAVVRGHLARDDLDFKHVCAIEIQRVMRGYISTMKVYEDIYKITVIQSFVRMKQAVDKASWKMAHIVQLQSVFRGFLVRRRQEYQQICAIAIQANWRRFYHRLNYQFDLLDIIIAQSVWRKKMAILKVESIRRRRLDKAAVMIQSKCRQIQCTAHYIQDMAHILVAQSALRRYLATKRARLIRDYWVIPAQAYTRGFLGRRALEKHRAARQIQSTWRGFVSYADYMFNIADIVTVQKVARGWLARREANHARKLNSAATTIQSACRLVLSKAQISRVSEVREMEKLSRELAEKEVNAATTIQTGIRRMQTQSAYVAFMAARRIQTFWRCRNLSNAYKYYRAAMAIQAHFRGMKSRQETLILRGEILAATIIQSAWRGFVSYTDYIFTVNDIITVQRVFRGHIARKTKDGATVQLALRKRRQKVAAARTIQKGCRGLLHRQRYWYTLGCTMQVQSWMRGRLVVLQLRREEKTRTAEQERSKQIEALVIQEKARNDVDEKRRHNAACTIQRFFVSVREEVDQLVRAAKRRKNWRKKMSRSQHGENGADDLLEGAWLDAACDSNLENDSFLAQTIANIGSQLESRGSKDMSTFEGSSQSIGNYSNEKDGRKSHPKAKKNLLPPSESNSTANEFSKLTGSETTFYRLPPARMRRMDSREMDDDLELEEAFMDTKIFNAKSRRIANKKRTYRP
ncbi:MAG: hypothetical protein SGBAC_002494 [Bacillariaceae sp.]